MAVELASRNASCRSGLRSMPRRKIRKAALANSLGGELQGFVYVFSHQVRVSLEDFGLRHSLRDHAHDGGDGNAEPADTGNATHLVRISRDPGEFHDGSLRANDDHILARHRVDRAQLSGGSLPRSRSISGRNTPIRTIPTVTALQDRQMTQSGSRRREWRFRNAYRPELPSIQP